MTDNVRLTNAVGAPVCDNQNSVSAGRVGPVTFEDVFLFEKLAYQNRERIPERTVHAKGWGAFGHLTVTGDISRYTCAQALQPRTRTPLLIRFSNVAAERGGADAERDVRGFAVKFYTSEGIWDLVGNNTPVFFVRDPKKFPDFIHTQKRHPRTNMNSPTAMWDFWSLSPESLHQVSILMSDRGRPRDPTQINGYGSHTFSLWNKEGERYWVKFHMKSMQGHAFFTDEEAEEVIGKNRESFQKALFEKIENGEFPRWRFVVQIATDEELKEKFKFDPFDLTKVWPHADFPEIEVGTIELNKNPDNYFAQIEQVGFSPHHVVPGIGFSPDKMLQGRLFAYQDAQRYRTGTHSDALPVNRPRCPVDTYFLDGAMNFFDHTRAYPDAYYEPNSVKGPKEDPSVKPPAVHLPGPLVVDQFDHRAAEYDDFSQVRAFWLMLRPDARARLCRNIATAMRGVPEHIVERQVRLFAAAHADYASGVRSALQERAHRDERERKKRPRKMAYERELEREKRREKRTEEGEEEEGEEAEEEEEVHEVGKMQMKSRKKKETKPKTKQETKKAEKKEEETGEKTEGKQREILGDVKELGKKKTKEQKKRMETTEEMEEEREKLPESEETFKGTTRQHLGEKDAGKVKGQRRREGEKQALEKGAESDVKSSQSVKEAKGSEEQRKVTPKEKTLDEKHLHTSEKEKELPSSQSGTKLSKEKRLETEQETTSPPSKSYEKKQRKMMNIGGEKGPEQLGEEQETEQLGEEKQSERLGKKKKSEKEAGLEKDISPAKGYMEAVDATSRMTKFGSEGEQELESEKTKGSDEDESKGLLAALKKQKSKSAHYAMKEGLKEKDVSKDTPLSSSKRPASVGAEMSESKSSAKKAASEGGEKIGTQPSE